LREGRTNLEYYPRSKWPSTKRNLKAAEKNAGTIGKKPSKDAKLRGD